MCSQAYCAERTLPGGPAHREGSSPIESRDPGCVLGMFSDIHRIAAARLT